MSQVVQGWMTAGNATTLLALSRSQVQRLLKRSRTERPAAVRHKARGRPVEQLDRSGGAAFAVMLVKEQPADFGPTPAAGNLAEDHGLRVSRERLRKQRRTSHQPRLRRGYYSEARNRCR
nr:helix-turn-helix domain-containing protein [Citreicella sp. C3M06]